MELSLTSTTAIALLFLIVAFLYSSVGHGGASGYLAVLSFFMLMPAEMASTALLLNIIVAGIAFAVYYRAGYFSARLTLPFLITSVPFAFLGGMVHIAAFIYSALLALALLAAAVRLIVNIESASRPERPLSLPGISSALTSGAAIGFLSGIVGVGGGIFLSPLILLKRWSDPKHTSATSACFIVVNSVAGILGRITHSTFSPWSTMPFMIAAVAGGTLGAWWGARKSSNIALRRLLAVVLLIASLKLIIAMI